jgi:hypothetical protein
VRDGVNGLLSNFALLPFTTLTLLLMLLSGVITVCGKITERRGRREWAGRRRSRRGR